MNKKIILCAAACVALAGCVTKQGAEDAGPPPTNAQQIAEAWVSQQLIDPYSAHFEHLGMTTGYSRLMFEKAYGWIECGTVNAKNRMGGYTGRASYFVTINRGRVVQGLIDDVSGPYVAANVCGTVVGNMSGYSAGQNGYDTKKVEGTRGSATQQPVGLVPNGN